MKKRLDLLVAERGLAPSREQAKALIMAGSIYVNGQKEDKSGDLFDEASEIVLQGRKLPYVSRGGLKLEKALDFYAEVRTHYVPLDNRPEIFGNQLFVNAEDEVVGEEKQLLLASTDLDLLSAAELVRHYGGAVYPAHIDRTSNGIIAILGAVPPEPGFTAVEVRDRENREKYVKDYGLEDKRVIVSSDAHHLWDIREDPESLELDDEPYSSAKVRRSLIKLLRGE